MNFILREVTIRHQHVNLQNFVLSTQELKTPLLIASNQARGKIKNMNNRFISCKYFATVGQ